MSKDVDRTKAIEGLALVSRRRTHSMRRHGEERDEEPTFEPTFEPTIFVPSCLISSQHVSRTAYVTAIEQPICDGSPGDGLRLDVERWQTRTMGAGESSASVDAGMRLLLASRSAELDAGARAIGWKIGINVPVLQSHFGLKGPVVGYLTDRTVIPVGQSIDASEWEHPALEVELAIRVGEASDVAGLAAAVELVDLNLPFETSSRSWLETFFIEASSSGRKSETLNSLSLRGLFKVDGQVVARGTLHELPAMTIEFVQVFLAERGATLAPGDRIIAGSLIAPGPSDRGTTLTSSSALGVDPSGHLLIDTVSEVAVPQ